MEDTPVTSKRCHRVVSVVKNERVGMGIFVLTCHSTCVIIEAQIGARRGSPCTSRSRARARRRRYGASQWTIYSRVRPAFAPLAVGVWVGAPRGWCVSYGTCFPEERQCILWEEYTWCFVYVGVCFTTSRKN